MNNTRKALTVLGAGALLCASLVAAVSVGASDHLDAPGVTADGRTDLNDLYAFQSPANPDNAVLVMTVNPLAGLQNGTTFHPKAKYFFNIDSDGDAVADTIVKVQFGKVKADGTQQMHVDVSGPNGSAAGNGTTGQTIAMPGGGRATAGTYDDPFFFDLEGFKNGFAFDGTDFFAGLNISAIVVELPRSLLGSGTLGIWSQTWLQGKTVDQVGRPPINTALIASDRKDAFNTTPPSQQWEERRHLIGFLADVDPEFAVELARADLAARSDVQSYAWLAWALLQAGRADEALPYVAPALRMGTQDAWLLYQTGSVYAAVGDVQRARPLLTEALALNPHFDLVHAERARRLLDSLPASE